MGIEAATYLDELVATNPLGSDQRKTIDDHVRLIKAVIQATFKKSDGTSIWDTAVEVDPINVSNGWIPVGGTILFQGNPATLPSNWQLSDGTNGTKDLRNKFIVAGATYNGGTGLWETTLTGSNTTSGGTSGASTITSSSTAITVDSHVLTVAELPAHSHFVANTDNAPDGGLGSLTASNYLVYNTSGANNFYGLYRLTGNSTAPTIGKTSDTGSGSGHTHTSPAHTHTVAYPSYYTLAYIVRLS